MSGVIPIQEPMRGPPPAPPAGFALWQLGFRPFYLLASGFAALSIALWALQYGGLAAARPTWTGPMWHAHEMLFGFTLAVIVGFLFTAGRNWTDQPTPTGWPLAALALLWVARACWCSRPAAGPRRWPTWPFRWRRRVALARPFVAARNRRNYFFVGLLLLLAAAALGVHLQLLGVLDAARLGRHPAGTGRGAVHHGGDGRPGGADVHQQRRAGRQGRAPCRAREAGAGLGAGAAGGRPAAAVRPAAGRARGGSAPGAPARWLLWQPWTHLRTPLVWVLHAAYLWIPVHLALRAAAELGWVPRSLATHALTVGAAGGLIIGMMTRTARGHTGAAAARRPRRHGLLRAGARRGAGARGGAAGGSRTWTVGAVLASAALWSAGFGLYALRYWPVLTRPRLDGRPG